MSPHDDESRPGTAPPEATGERAGARLGPVPAWRLVVALVGLPALLAADAVVRQLTGEDGLQPGVAVLALACLLGAAATGFSPERATERRAAQVVGAALTVVGAVLSVAYWMA